MSWAFERCPVNSAAPRFIKRTLEAYVNLGIGGILELWAE
jgi:hypothetical protein